MYHVYAPDIATLGENGMGCEHPDRTHACLIGARLANSSPARPMYGYYFGVKPGPEPQTFLVWGIPLDGHKKAFCVIDDAVVRIDATGSSATAMSYASCKTLPEWQPWLKTRN
jgi:hypothetical protein